MGKLTEKYQAGANSGGVYRYLQDKNGARAWHGGLPHAADPMHPSDFDPESAYGTLSGGSYRTTNPSAAHTFLGCYSEGGEQNRLAPATITTGGVVNRLSPASMGVVAAPAVGVENAVVRGPAVSKVLRVPPQSAYYTPITVAASESLILVDDSTRKSPTIILPANDALGTLTGYQFTIKRTDELKDQSAVKIQITTGKFEEDPKDLGKEKLTLKNGGAAVTVVADAGLDAKGCRYRVVSRYQPNGDDVGLD